MKQEGSGGMSVKNEGPTAKINFAVVYQKSDVIFLCRAIFLAVTVAHSKSIPLLELILFLIP